MNYLNSDGTINSDKIILSLRSLAKNVNDSIYYCFDDLSNDKRLLAIETYTKILTMSDDIQRQENEFFNET